MTGLAALLLVERPELAGARIAVRVGGTLYVSPAMADLLTHATPDELQHLGRHLLSVNLTHLAPFLRRGERLPALVLALAGVPAECPRPSTPSSTAPPCSPPPGG